MNKLKTLLNKKLKKNGGFTLVEMLIVVAIIAILIAVSIPLVSNALEKARDATDQANERAAKAEVLLVFLSGADIKTNNAATPLKIAAATPFGKIGSTGATGDADVNIYYDAAAGCLTTVKPTVPYGKCTWSSGNSHYTGLSTNPGADHTAFVLEVGCNANGEVTLTWN